MDEPTLLIPSDGMLTADQAATLCGVDRDTIYSWVHRRILPVAGRKGRYRWYNLIDVARAEALTRGVARRPAPTLRNWGIEGEPDADIAQLLAAIAERAAEDPIIRSPLVYYVQFGDRIKIGTTIDLPWRLHDVPCDAVLATEPGDRQLEHQRHEQFAEFRIYREWFRPGRPLMDHIATLPAEPLASMINSSVSYRAGEACPQPSRHWRTRANVVARNMWQ